VSIGENESKSQTIRVLNPVWIRPTVVGSTGEDPVEGAVLEVRTHEDDPDYKWREVETGPDGRVDTPGGKVWLYPSRQDGGFYIVDVFYEGEKVASEHINKLTGNRDITIDTSVSLTPTKTRTATLTRTPTVSPEQASAKASQTETATAPPALSATPTTVVTPTGLSGWVNEVVLVLLSTEALVATATVFVVVLIAVTWQYSERSDE
jgi:hypothetical protein